MYFPCDPKDVRWSITPTTDNTTEVTLVNYDGTVDPNYARDYAFNSSGLIIKNATTTAEPGHQLSTAGLYTARCGRKISKAKVLVVSKLSHFLRKHFAILWHNFSACHSSLLGLLVHSFVHSFIQSFILNISLFKETSQRRWMCTIVQLLQNKAVIAITTET